MSYIPNLRNNTPIYQGYQRGWGLEFGELKQKVLADPLYIEALEFSDGSSLVSEYRRMNIFLILKFFYAQFSKFDLIEYGSYKLGNALFMAYICRELYPNINIYALDTFEGMPKTDSSVDLHSEGDFSDVDFQSLVMTVKQKKIKNLTLVKGRFEDTSKILDGKTFGFCHIDCDIYSAVVFAYQSIKPHLVKNAYIVLDDATVSSCMGATRAVEDSFIMQDKMNSEQIFPHYVFRAK